MDCWFMYPREKVYNTFSLPPLMLISFSETRAGRNMRLCQLLLSTSTVGPLNLAGKGKLLVAAKSFKSETYWAALRRSICFQAFACPHCVVTAILGGPCLPFRVVMMT